jgi:hypothetical protein
MAMVVRVYSSFSGVVDCGLLGGSRLGPDSSWFGVAVYWRAGFCGVAPSSFFVFLFFFSLFEWRRLGMQSLCRLRVDWGRSRGRGPKTLCQCIIGGSGGEPSGFGFWPDICPGLRDSTIDRFVLFGWFGFFLCFGCESPVVSLTGFDPGLAHLPTLSEGGL